MSRRRSNKVKPAEMFPLSNEYSTVGGDFDESLQTFLHGCKIRNLSEETLTYYRRELTTFRKRLEEQGIDPTPRNVTTRIIHDNVIGYMLDARKMKDVSINTRLRAVRAFFNYLHKEGYIACNPMAGVKLIKQKKTVIPAFTKEQLNAILRQPDLNTFTGVRDYTIMLLLIETGLRAKELCGLRIGHIRWDDSTILVTDAKGYKERLVPIQTAMKKQLRQYLSIRGEIVDEHALFVTIDNEPMSKRQLQNMIRRYGNRANIIGVRCSPHTFRHTFAKMCVKGGAGIFELQHILGHTSMEMVRRYVNLFSDDVKEKHKIFSPLRQL